MKEAELRPGDIRMFQGATSEPPSDFAVTEYEEAQPDDDNQEPIPVIVVDTVQPADYIDWAGESFAVTDAVAPRIAGSRENRTRMLVSNLGPDAVYVVRTPVSAWFTGAPIPPNTVIELTTNREVCAVCAVGETATVGVIQEFNIDADN